jgi:hemoglobin-like flavoprotein
MQARGCAEICQAFELLAAKDTDLQQETYRLFFQLCPEAQGLMGHSDEPMRGRMLEQTYELLMDAKLQGPESYFRWEIRNHVSAYGVSASMYGTFFQALEAAVAQALGGDWTPQMAKAWQQRIEDLLHEVASA